MTDEHDHGGKHPQPNGGKIPAHDDADRRRAARTFLVGKHEGRRIDAYHSFRTRISPDYDYLADGKGVLPAIRALFSAVFDSEDFYSTGTAEVLQQLRRSAVTRLRTVLLKERCSSPDMVDGLIQELTEHAHRAVFQLPAPPANTPQDAADSNAGSGDKKKLQPHQDPEWMASAVRSDIHAYADAIGLYSRLTIPVQKAIATESFTGDLMKALQAACRTETFDADTAVATAAVMLRDVYTQAPEMLKYPELEALHLVRFPMGKGDGSLPKQHIMNNETISEAAAVVLLAWQTRLAREIAIETPRALQLHLNRTVPEEDYVRYGRCSGSIWKG